MIVEGIATLVLLGVTLFIVMWKTAAIVASDPLKALTLTMIFSAMAGATAIGVFFIRNID